MQVTKQYSTPTTISLDTIQILNQFPGLDDSNGL